MAEKVWIGFLCIVGTMGGLFMAIIFVGFLAKLILM